MNSAALPSFLLRSAAPALAASSVVFLGTAAKAEPPIKPVYQTNFLETQVNVAPGAPSNGSFGYFFDTNLGNTRLTALGFPFFTGWADTTGSPTQFPNAAQFDVYLWRIDGINQPSLAPCDGSTPYCQVAKVTFDQTQTENYTLQDGYYWQKITPINLGKESASSADMQYATAAVGNFSLADGLPTLVGAPFGGTFDPAFSWTGNGFNSPTPFYTPDFSADYPVPWNFVSDPASANDPLTYYAYFSPNLSYTLVPSPMPLLGAGAAFGWARRIRRRVGASSRRAVN